MTKSVGKVFDGTCLKCQRKTCKKSRNETKEQQDAKPLISVREQPCRTSYSTFCLFFDVSRMAKVNSRHELIRIKNFPLPWNRRMKID